MSTGQPRRKGEKKLMAAIIDISVDIYTGMPFYPGDPGAAVEPVHAISGGAVANIAELRLGSHVGTHVDAPRHFLDDGTTVDKLSLEALIGPARVLDLTGVEELISSRDLEDAGIDGATRVLLKTRNSALWGEPEFQRRYVALGEDAARLLVGSGVHLAGIDYLSVERFRPEAYTVHETLLGAGVVLLEGIDLSGVAAGDYQLCCLPLKVRGGDGAPARAVLMEVEDRS